MICDIQRFSLNDGPGIRTTVFMKGCPLSCKWCHNPEAIRPQPEILFYPLKCAGCRACVAACPTGARSYISIAPDRERCVGCGACASACYTGALALSGRDLSVQEVMDEVVQDAPYYRRSGGGVTLSGGECLMQPELSGQILKACREQGIATALETCLQVRYEALEALLPLLDLVMLDVKLAGAEEHRTWTGASNDLILENLKKLAQTGMPLIIRTPVIPGVNDTAAQIAAIARIVRDIKSLEYYELLNYNPLGESKYEALGIPYAFKGQRPLTQDEMESLKAAALFEGVSQVRIG